MEKRISLIIWLFIPLFIISCQTTSRKKTPKAPQPIASVNESVPEIQPDSDKEDEAPDKPETDTGKEDETSDTPMGSDDSQFILPQKGGGVELTATQVELELIAQCIKTGKCTFLLPLSDTVCRVTKAAGAALLRVESNLYANNHYTENQELMREVEDVFTRMLQDKTFMDTFYNQVEFRKAQILNDHARTEKGPFGKYIIYQDSELKSSKLIHELIHVWQYKQMGTEEFEEQFCKER